MRAYAFGILDPEGERYELAVAHTRQCPACRAHVASLRGLAAVLPPLPLTLLLAGGGGALAGTAGGAGRSGGTTATTGGVGSGATTSTSTGTGAGWIGGAGSLGAKLAVVAVAAVGVGFALHGSGAHGSSDSATRVVVASLPTSGGTGSRLSLVTPLAPVRRKPAIRKRPSHRVRRRVGVTRGCHLVRGGSATVGSTSAPEFGPERVRTPSTGSPQRSVPSAGEFGF
jgi:hypothetical protein